MKRIITLLAVFLILSDNLYAQSILDLVFKTGSKTPAKVKFIEGDADSNDEVLLINVKGTIVEKTEPSSPLRPVQNIPAEIKKDLKLAENRDAIKAILLEINSPGGEVTCCDIITHNIKTFSKRTGKPVVAIISSMGASGGYHVACAAKKIYAHPTSIVGSIGVMIQTANIQKLADFIGFRPVILKSDKTPMKDILSPYREMTDAERDSLMKIVNSMYDRFVNIVSESRGLSKEQVITLANGSIYTAEDAKEKSLIDEIGYREDAFEEACKLANIKSAALVSRIERKGLGQLLGELTEIHSGMPLLQEKITNAVEYGIPTTLQYK